MHKSSMLRMEWFRDTFCSGNPARSSVLDIGSMSYAGHDTHRSLFTEEKQFNYCGLDMAPGPNVDIVVKHPLPVERDCR
jgi:hypothetical protein